MPSNDYSERMIVMLEPNKDLCPFEKVRGEETKFSFRSI
jgi:hypothetical protein